MLNELHWTILKAPKMLFNASFLKKKYIESRKLNIRLFDFHAVINGQTFGE